jgi:hypothetical protein
MNRQQVVAGTACGLAALAALRCAIHRHVPLPRHSE